MNVCTSYRSGIAGEYNDPCGKQQITMKRIPEPELMNEMEQARAYAGADFEEPHSMFIDALAARIPRLSDGGHALDLGCGPADISIRFARRFPGYFIDAVDGAEAMLLEAKRSVDANNLQGSIRLIHAMIDELDKTETQYNCIFSNSLLHHLHDPQVLWNCIKTHTRDSEIFVMDLLRPESEQKADELVERYSGNESEVLKKDFRNSLLAAFTLTELKQQLIQADLGQMQTEQISDRHMIIYGKH